MVDPNEPPCLEMAQRIARLEEFKQMIERKIGRMESLAQETRDASLSMSETVTNYIENHDTRHRVTSKKSWSVILVLVGTAAGLVSILIQWLAGIGRA